MAEPLKNIYNDSFFDILTQASESVIPGFDTDSFLKQIYDKEWEKRELKERMRHITLAFNEQLPDDYKTSVDLILKLIPKLRQPDAVAGTLGFIFLPDFIELYGIEYPDISADAMEQITPFVSCEFAVRPFIKEYPEKMMAKMQEWSEHDNHHVRRFASEGCRPRLPWAMALPSLKKDPSPVLPILEKLKNDPSEYVRRSVANNLNDISKDHPMIAIETAKRWNGSSLEVDKVVKHACRTLLKQGNREVMTLFGYGETDHVSIKGFTIRNPVVKVGEYLEFSFDLYHNSNTPGMIRLEYAVYFLLSNGSHSRKVFKISEKEYPENSVSTVERRQSFKPITTRRYYPGIHKVGVIVNGKQFGSQDFELLEN